MEKAEIKPGIAALIIVATMFAGWEATLIVTALLLLFCDLEDRVKNILIKVLTFTAGLALFTLCWSLIVQGITVVVDTIVDIVGVINGYLDVESKIDITDLQRYFLTPVKSLTTIADNIVGFLFLFAKFAFVVAIITGKQMKNNFFFDKINGYVNKFINYVNNTDNGTQPVDTPVNNNNNNNNAYPNQFNANPQ